MSQGPSRGYNYSSLPRQPVMSNQPPFQLNSPTTLNSTPSKSTSSTQETLYCDSCQTFRHVSFFSEKEFKYNVCNICHTREIQKRKHQLERYEVYEEQQRTIKQAKYQTIQYPQQNNAPITLNTTPAPQTIVSPQLKPSPPVLNTSPLQNTKPVPMRNQSQLQSYPSLEEVFETPSPKPVQSDTMDLDQFVKELEKEKEFDRKQYLLNIESLMESMENPGFTQLGRGICEKVLEGTTFNFSLKDRRRSTKSPDTLSTLRYYCSQRSDTAKPRKGDNPKVQNRYDCAGALTIIIDLTKKTAQVTVIHKHAHPPFNSQHLKKPTPPLGETNPVDRQFDRLRQKVVEIGLLLEGQQRFGNPHFLQAATEALANAEEMLEACQSFESTNTPYNKYTMHYNKTHLA